MFATTFAKLNRQFISVVQKQVPFMCGTYFCMGPSKHNNMVVVIKIVAYIYGVLILCGGAYYSDFIKSMIA